MNQPMKVTATSTEPVERFVRPVKNVSAPFEEIDDLSMLECGFRQNWIDGGGGPWEEISVDSGAGLGSRWLTVSLKPRDGSPRRAFRLDVEKLLHALLAQLAQAEGGG